MIAIISRLKISARARSRFNWCKKAPARATNAAAVRLPGGLWPSACTQKLTDYTFDARRASAKGLGDEMPARPRIGVAKSYRKRQSKRRGGRHPPNASLMDCIEERSGRDALTAAGHRVVHAARSIASRNESPRKALRNCTGSVHSILSICRRRPY